MGKSKSQEAELGDVRDRVRVDVKLYRRAGWWFGAGRGEYEKGRFLGEQLRVRGSMWWRTVLRPCCRLVSIW